MLARVIVQIVLFLALQGAVLFVAAGSVEWPGAGAFLGIMGTVSFAISLWLLKHDPALLAERLSPVVQRRQAVWDRVLMAECLVLWFGWLAFTAGDTVRWRWLDVPVRAQVVGGAGMVATFYSRVAPLSGRPRRCSRQRLRSWFLDVHDLLTRPPRLRCNVPRVDSDHRRRTP